MRSIRLSLLVYFLGLLALALGTASVLAYQTAQRTLQAKKATTEQLIENQYRERCREEESRLDEWLRVQAHTMARLVQFQIDWNRVAHNQSLYTLGLLTSQLAPNGYVLTPTWLFSGVRGSPRARNLYDEIFRRNVPEIQLNEDDLTSHGEEPADYFQIDSVLGNSYRSHSLGNRRFPDPSTVAPGEVLYTNFEDVSLGGGLRVRRVLLKTPIARPIHPIYMLNRGRAGRPNRPEGDPPPPRVEPPIRPPLFIQCAYDVRRREEAQEKFQQRRDEELAALQTETVDALAGVRNHLLVIGSLTFLAAIAGSIWLVHLGLLPLRRLSEAVSKISPRDFQLPFGEKRLPAELNPIVQRLQVTLDLLKRAFAREKQATADISHELRTPLSVLLTTSELALRKPRSAEEYRELLQDCRVSAQQMNEIVQRLLTLARLDAGVDQLQQKPIDASQLADQCLALVRPLAEARGLTLSSTKPAALPLRGDPDKLREVLNNLLHNAIQYNRPRGRIDVRLGRQNGNLEMEVSDTGIGIDPEAHGQIFERFYRTDTSRTGDGLHAGLGLALVKEYVNLMRGSIDVESVPGQGSTFRVRLPV